VQEGADRIRAGEPREADLAQVVERAGVVLETGGELLVEPAFPTLLAAELGDTRVGSGPLGQVR